MPRFSIKDLMLAMTLVAVGVGMVCYAERHHETPESESLAVFLFFSGSALFAAGLTTPFKRPWLGALVVVVLVILLAFFPPAV